MAGAPARGGRVRRIAVPTRQIERRLEILGGYIIAFLNLDEVIRIIREEDEPKAVLMATFKLTDVQPRRS